MKQNAIKYVAYGISALLVLAVAGLFFVQVLEIKKSEEISQVSESIELQKKALDLQMQAHQLLFALQHVMDFLQDDILRDRD